MSETLSPPEFSLTLSLGEHSGMTDTANANRALILDAYERMFAGESEALAGLLDPDVLFAEAESLPYGVTVRGIAGARQGVAKMFTAWRSLAVEIHEFTAAGDLVIAYLTMKGVGRETADVYEGMTAEVFRLNDGKIIEWRPIYWDTHRVRQVCGPA